MVHAENIDVWKIVGAVRAVSNLAVLAIRLGLGHLVGRESREIESEEM